MNAFCPSYDDLILRYINVCNESLMANHHRFPFQQIFSAVESSEQNVLMEWVVLDQCSTSSYYVSLNDQKICLCDKNCYSTSMQDTKRWKVSKDYLECVTTNPAPYISNPAKINWDWCFSVSND